MAQGLFNLKQVNAAIQQGGWSAQKPVAVDYLVVAGGGGASGGAAYGGGGGGAGGLLAGYLPVPNSQTLLVTVGGGGTGGNTGHGTNGSDSVFGQITSTGGGYGSYGYTIPGENGGSGGGGGGTYSASVTNVYSNGVAGQGYGGGAQVNYGNGSGGGGGAGSRGYSTTDVNGAQGGGGVASAITGAVTVYAGGGGGAATASGNTGGVGGVGGGGNGATGVSIEATAGTVNTGGGGGGGSNMGTRIGGNGGSGIVAISYPDVYAAPTATTGSPTVSTSGSGSMLLNGTTQTLTFASNAVFGMGTGDFTVEFWINTSDVSGDIVGVTGGFNLTLATNTMYWQSLKDSTNLYSLSGSAITNGAWHHIAVCRSGTSNRIFYDGAAQGSSPYTDTTNYGVSGNLVIGNGGVGYLAANISNLRIVKGTALYTSNFTPSTTPLTAISGTSLLLSTVSGGYLNDNSTNGFSPNSTIATAPTWNASSPFSVTGYKNRVYTWTSSGSITF